MHDESWKQNWKKPDLTSIKPIPGIIDTIVITEWGWAVQYPKNIIIGNYVDIGYGCYLNARYGIIIEDDVEIGGGCHIYSNNSIDGVCGKVVLKQGSKIGAHSVILPRVTVGKNAVVGAMSLVKENTKIPDGEVWVGVPAEFIKKL